MRKIYIALLAATVAGWTTTGCSPDAAQKGAAADVAPDNTGRNVRDRGDTLTSGDQSESEADRTLTQKVRQAVVADDSLSTTAKNVKIITVNGVVTLRGPVKDDKERTRITTAATTIAGAGKVQNQLEIATP
jgi:hyperosmotically inducible periplasmic protein